MGRSGELGLIAWLCGWLVVAPEAGWPMSVFLTPTGLKPFTGGTYFPPERFASILERQEPMGVASSASAACSLSPVEG